MARTIINQDDLDRRVTGGAASSTRVPDGYADRLIKYIPPDVIAAYIAIEGMVETGNLRQANLQVLAWIVLAVITAACPFYLTKGAGITKPAQVGLSTVAFLVWAFAYSGPPFSFYGISGIWRSVILALFTFVVPLIPV